MQDRPTPSAPRGAPPGEDEATLVPLPGPLPSPGRAEVRNVVELPTNALIWFVSDLHLGDGTPSDAFMGKDAHLIALVERAHREGAILVINGDAVDFHQAWSFHRVLRAHKRLLGALSRLGREGRLVYVIGNHDHDISLFDEILSFRVCDEVHVGDDLLVRHGYEYDPYILDMMADGQWHTYVHHMLERWLGTWLRIPLGEFYTWPNRVGFWVGHKAGMMATLAQRVGEWLDVETPVADEVLANLDFWTWSNLGDSMGIFRPAFQEARTGRFRGVVCGHSHVPGVVREGDRFYANSGSWTFSSSQYLVWNGEQMRCFDWMTGREYRDELYGPMLDGTLYERDFPQWWRENYMGWLRFREGEERGGRLPGWKRLLADRHQLAALREPLPSPEREAAGGSSRGPGDDRRLASK